MKALLIGYGEVGRGICGAWKDNHIIQIHDPTKGYNITIYFPDILLVTIPYNNDFISTCQEYKRQYWGVPMIVFSSIPIGTCRQIPAVHSPIEGDHTNMAESIKKHIRYVGGSSDTAWKFFEQAGCKVRKFANPDHTEFLKLRSTTVYGINIEFARYSKEVADRLGMDYASVKDYDLEYNRIVRETNRGHLQRQVLDPPEGRIGGHCIISNAKLLSQSHPNHLVDFLVANNTTRTFCTKCGKRLDTGCGTIGEINSIFNIAQRNKIGCVCNNCNELP